MENKEIAKQMIDLHKTSFENCFSTMVILQDKVEAEKVPISPALEEKFVLVPAGTFQMGESGKQHQVMINKPFYMQTMDVTHAQWKKVMRSNPSFFNNYGDDCPVEAEYQISSSVNEGILEVAIKGKLTKSSAEEITNEFCAITKANGIEKVLVDVRALNGRLRITETYERVRSLPPHMYKIYIVIVDISGNAAYKSFHEYTLMNAGIRVKWFIDIDAARAWLKSKQSK